LKVDAAAEYAIKNSKFVATSEVLIYMSGAIEAFIGKDRFSVVKGIGLMILIMGYMMVFIVIKRLGGIWSLKLFILANHPIIKSGLYKV
ncbi:isoprenylcysteine carboxylmethyltransferase family protein, partial [Staphylococcus epidermidis]|uniref:isoprenylcysteine carboxylmethyltransferase family protein n=1 Tax=Staphylococcus epidermidis TaxID=1282 RepID=UPI0028CB2371